ncbi:MAG: PIG-L family deacetylase [Candidatus Aminicenantes bacterium]|nr:PIG-L family deacetylase [Candidatus Aminicenantes bacterium]
MNSPEPVAAFSFAPGQRLQIIVPHPDDESLGAGGLIQRALQQGADCRVVIASDGNRRNKMKIRRRELFAAAAHLGLRPDAFVFLDFPDGRLARSPELPSRTADCLRDFSPTTIIVSDPLDRHADHACLGRIVSALFPQITSARLLLGSLIHFRGFPKPRGYQPQSELTPPRLAGLPDSVWLRLPLTLEEQNHKRAAVAEYRSQGHLFLRRLLRSHDRTNELFRVLAQR